ncbi:MAG: archaemetzincin family Zn-dependent metalloprotease [bacterium]|nr:archaemetzincin family Zn-dependent metalloprotease [bacterium]
MINRLIRAGKYLETILSPMVCFGMVVIMNNNGAETEPKEQPKPMICLVSVGNDASAVFPELRQEIKETYGYEVTARVEVPLPEMAYDQKRNRYLVVPVLNRIGQRVPDEDCLKVLGIADVDLVTNELHYVFGKADGISGRVAVISLQRLRQEFYRKPPDRKLFSDRVAKEAVHELGHLFGLQHCENPECVMFFSKSIADTDKKGKKLCSGCSQRINTGRE